MPTRDIDQDHHRIKGHPSSEDQAPLMLPYTPLPVEVLPADSRCSVHLFVGGITSVATEFIREIQGTEGAVRLTEDEWVERFSQFIAKPRSR
jgi:hypothetical protein